MKIFLSYACTGEDEDEVKYRLEAVRDALVAIGHDVYCFHFDEVRVTGMAPAECLRHALEVMDAYDCIFVINTSERRSEGILLEVGAALARKKRIILAQHASSIGMTYLPELSDECFVWHTEDELINKSQSIFSHVGESHEVAL